VDTVTAEHAVAQKDFAALGAEVREGVAADAISGAEGIAPAFVALPASTDEAAAVMRVAAGHELAVVVRGAGSRLGWGVPPARCDLVIDTSRMSGVVEHASGDLVARVQAGARIGDVATVLARAGQEIALDVPATATIGGIVASGLAGPRRLRYGTPRDLLIGITIVRADGTVAKSGGKVVKNVAGYDLGKLMAGSAGTLALITEAIFRLHPLPASRVYVTAEYGAVSVACDAVAAAANSPLVASAVELHRAAPDGPLRVGVLLEGSADGVAHRALRMAGLLGTADIAERAPDWWPGAPAAADGGTLVRVSFWVSALGAVLDAIEVAAIAAGVSPVIAGSAGAGVLYLRLEEDVSAETRGEQPVRVAGFTSGLRAALAGRRGTVVVLTAPAAVRRELGVDGGMHGPVPSLSLMRAVKEQFDPDQLMSPGRLPEGI
jgi:glycolate dehydrogenase FAD-binding subunit